MDNTKNAAHTAEVRPVSRFLALDGLRGLAALLVAGCHFVAAFHWSLLSGAASSSHFPADTWISHTPIILLFNPELGVTIFFILSGFVLASSVSETRSALHILIFRRWLRLAIPIVAASLFAWSIPALGLNFVQFTAPLAKSNWLAEEYTHITLSAWEFVTLLFQSGFTLLISQGGWGETARRFNSNLWTMPIEFIGSIGLYAAYRLFLDDIVPKNIGRFTFISLLLLLLWNTPFAGFPAGAALFEFQKSARRTAIERPWLASKKLALVIGAAVFLAGLTFAGTPFELDLPGGGFYAHLALWINVYVEPASAITVLHHIGAFCIVGSALLFQPFRAVLEFRTVQFLGRISFMVYLLQLPILCSLAASIVFILTPQTGYNIATIVAAMAYIPTVLLVAAIFTQYIDIPAIHASRRLSAILGSRKRPLQYKPS